MNITAERLAELLAGIARAQTAIIDAVERAEPGWRSNHLLPVLTVAANTRLAQPRLIDLASRVLLRAQSRGGVDMAALAADLERLLGEAQAPAAKAPAGAAELDFSPNKG